MTEGVLHKSLCSQIAETERASRAGFNRDLRRLLGIYGYDYGPPERRDFDFIERARIVPDCHRVDDLGDNEYRVIAWEVEVSCPVPDARLRKYVRLWKEIWDSDAHVDLRLNLVDRSGRVSPVNLPRLAYDMPGPGRTWLPTVANELLAEAQAFPV